MLHEDCSCKLWRRINPGQWEELTDPRNAEDYDTWDFGMEPIPHDTTWAKKPTH